MALFIEKLYARLYCADVLLVALLLPRFRTVYIYLEHRGSVLSIKLLLINSYHNLYSCEIYIKRSISSGICTCV